ncbi:hypothetical protein ACWED2_05970 [Amycolatopsis sp. NPDC005003]
MRKLAAAAVVALAAPAIAFSAGTAEAETGWIGFNSAGAYGCQSWVGWVGSVEQLHVKCAGTGRDVKVRGQFVGGCGQVTTGWRFEYNHADCRGGGLDAGMFKLR